MKVTNIKSSNGNAVPNRFIISDIHVTVDGILLVDCDVFQSYDSIIAVRDLTGRIFLDEKYWNYSKTTSRYRSQFLGETTKETQAKIDNGTYKLVNLNK